MSIPKKRLAVVTGGSAGIGEAICRQLLDDGWAVVSMARRPPPFTHEHLHSVEVDECRADHPPFGMLLFTMRSVAPNSITTRQIYAADTPYVLFGLLMLVAVMAVPGLATWLPRLLLGKWAATAAVVPGPAGRR